MDIFYVVSDINMRYNGRAEKTMNGNTACFYPANGQRDLVDEKRVVALTQAWWFVAVWGDDFKRLRIYKLIIKIHCKLTQDKITALKITRFCLAILMLQEFHLNVRFDLHNNLSSFWPIGGPKNVSN